MTDDTTGREACDSTGSRSAGGAAVGRSHNTEQTAQRARGDARAAIIALSIVLVSIGALTLLLAHGILPDDVTEEGAVAEISTGLEEAREGSPVGIYLDTTTTGSMAPTMPAGDTALCLSWVPIEEGDVVAFRSEQYPGNEVRHRVVEIDGDRVVTRGDANDYRDDPISRDQITCKVVWSEHAGLDP